MSTSVGGLAKCLRGISARPTSSLGLAGRGSRRCLSTSSSSDESKESNAVQYNDLLDDKTDFQPHGVDPRKGWAFRGVYKAIILGKVGQIPVQKILRNGRTVTVFTVGTGGMFDQRILPSSDIPRPAQWHRVAVHNERLGAYVVQQLVKSSSVFVEGDIETRVYNDGINGQIRNVPEICVRQDGNVRLVKAGEGTPKIPLDVLKEGLW